MYFLKQGDDAPRHVAFEETDTLAEKVLHQTATFHTRQGSLQVPLKELATAWTVDSEGALVERDIERATAAKWTRSLLAIC